MLLLSVFESLLYYCCLLLISLRILDCRAKKLYLYVSFITFAPLLLIAIYGNNTLHNIAYILFEIGQFLLVKLIFPKIKLCHVIFSYIVIYSVNILLISVISFFVSSHYLLIDLIVNTLTTTLIVLFCLNGNKAKLQRMIEWVPRRIVVVVSLLLTTTVSLSITVFGSDVTSYEVSWDNAIRLMLILLLFSICLVLPLLILTSISNNQLKSLTANYEQQIEAQAKHYKELAAANYETRRFKHDFNNMRIAIEKTLADGKNEQALALIQQCGNALENPTGAPAAFNTGNGIADALLTDKQQRASHCNAIIQFDGTLPQNCLSPTDLCVILGNTLDNAIEACQKLSPKAKKVISVACHCNSGFAFLSICNPVAERVNVDHNYVATTKENKTLHGFGLYSLQSVVKKYEGNLEFLATDDAFSVEIDLCLMPDKAAAHSPHVRH